MPPKRSITPTKAGGDGGDRWKMLEPEPEIAAEHERDLRRAMESGRAASADKSEWPAGQQHGQAVLRRLYAAHVLQCLSTTLREQAAPGLVYSLFQNDMVKSAAFLGSYDSCSGLIAFMVSPSFGSLSDWLGRKPFLLLWPVASTLLSGLVAWQPVRWLLFLQMATLGALVNAFETNVRSVIPDVVSGDARAVANANIGACQGAAFFIGSGVTGVLSGVDPRLSMLAAAVSSTLAGMVLATVPETLRGERKPFKLQSSNPLGFLDLLRGSSDCEPALFLPVRSSSMSIHATELD